MMLPLSAPASLLDSIFSVVASIVFKLGWTRLPIVYIYDMYMYNEFAIILVLVL